MMSGLRLALQMPELFFTLDINKKYEGATRYVLQLVLALFLWPFHHIVLVIRQEIANSNQSNWIKNASREDWSIDGKDLEKKIRSSQIIFKYVF